VVQWHPAVIPLSASALIAVIVGVVAWRRRHTASAGPALVHSMVGVAIWCLCDLGARVSTTLTSQLLFEHVLYVGVVLIPAGCLILAFEISGRGDVLSRRTRRLLLVHPILTLAAVATNPWHQLFINGGRVVGSDPVELDWHRGPLFWAHTAYSYVVLAIAILVLAGGWARAPRAFRRQMSSALAASLVPLLFNAVNQFQLIDVGRLDLTPIAFTVTGVLFAWALFRQQLLDLIPVARDGVIDTMGDGVVIVDRYGRVADLNPAAAALFGRGGGRLGLVAVGDSATDVFTGWPGVLPLSGDRQHEVRVGAGSGIVDVRVTRLLDRVGRAAGHLLVLRDVTESRQAERALAAANAVLRDQLVEIERLRAELEQQAIRDALTGLFNRRYLDEMLVRELARAAREEYPVSIALLDVDHFKSVNDTFGHAAGDRMLVAIGGLLTGGVRAGDVACRYGGEELLVVLPNAGRDIAAARAEQWREMCADLRVSAGPEDIPGEETHDEDRRDISVTLSIGVATFPGDGTDAATLLAAADRALYAAKAGGRNRVVTAEPEPLIGR
jgi:diguanylate cyclase (GGDEF)-like protein